MGRAFPPAAAATAAPDRRVAVLLLLRLRIGEFGSETSSTLKQKGEISLDESYVWVKKVICNLLMSLNLPEETKSPLMNRLMTSGC